MENMWQFEKVEANTQTPKEILSEQAGLLPSITGDMVYASVTEESVGNDGGSFTFNFYIKSKFLTNYRFRVLSIKHGIPVYPVNLVLDHDIKTELEFSKGVIEVQNELEFKDILKRTLSSKRIGTVISSIIQLSK